MVLCVPTRAVNERVVARTFSHAFEFSVGEVLISGDFGEVRPAPEPHGFPPRLAARTKRRDCSGPKIWHGRCLLARVFSSDLVMV